MADTPPVDLTDIDPEVLALLQNPYFRLHPRRSKYNLNLWWQYTDKDGKVLIDPSGKAMENYRQLAFIQVESPECFFGGSSGGGKTAAAAMDALRYFDIPKYAALIMRRTWVELSEGVEAIIPFMKEKLEPFMFGKNPQVWYLEKEHAFYSIEGAVIQFAHAENEKDIEKRAGTPYQRIYFEELTSFTEYQYDFMFTRQRKRAHGLVAQVPVVMRGTGNPLGVGFEFVKQRFIIDRNQERVFIPSGILDNPFIDQRDYIKRLEKLPEVLRKKYMDGDWDIQFSGGIIDRNWFELVPTMPHCKFYVRGWDLAGTVPVSGNNNPDWTVGILNGYDYAGTKNVYIDSRNMKRFRLSAGDVERVMEKTFAEDGNDVLQVIEQQPGEAGKREAKRLRQKWMGKNIRFVPVTGQGNSKEQRIGYDRRTGLSTGFVSYATCRAANEGHVKIVTGPGSQHEVILNEMAMFGQKSVKDDIVDAESLCFFALTTLTQKTVIASGMVNTTSGAEALYRQSRQMMGLARPTRRSSWI